MEYKVHELAKLAGVSDRTLRYYDNTGLLRPSRADGSGYRLYAPADVDRLQQILFLRELGVGLGEIAAILDAPGYDRAAALEAHLASLTKEKLRIETLMENIGRTLESLKGEKIMTDRQKFEGFKKEAVEKNEKTYGAEVRAKYGDAAADASNAKVMNMSEEQWAQQDKLTRQIAETLKAAMAQGDPAGELAQKACALHRQWLCMFWGDGKYSKQAHRGLGEMYVADERFRSYYDAIEPGAAAFLRDALNVYCK
ncbi:MAG: MerR family transcriptional regulator [Oscillospiraceae bacterium]|nr:MerR family transcriptional regulator [Oscillospiraceae bacterium]